ncbi:hypothetical protein GH741_11605 [Aquibacillus halophilus]|uniref:Uncharacterized protein n=1 Tax=Aquibacillus halophilus TaxID=930132 RepID=A0A6A8DC89_9BACI|nr:hypothetical protein [Aquibacillus halophilus]MRH43325.1 hypothetical protein [Aquibacillus halophilus]
MVKLKVEIKNCYGISSLENEFDFTKGKSTQVIYAPNGVMKTSFANVFDDYSNSVESSDLIYPNKKSIRKIITDDGSEIPTESVFVIRPYEKSYKSDRISTLLVSDDLRKQYEKVHEKIAIEKENLIEILKIPSGLNKDIEEELSSSFGQEKNNLLQLLCELEDKIDKESDFEYSHIIFNKIFNEKVVSFLETGDFKREIKEYIEKYDELISNSAILKKDFNHFHATTVQKNLNSNGFFKAEHSINLNIDGQKKEISDPKEFLKLIMSAKEEILQDKTLQGIFEKIDKKISNNQLREFREYLFENQDVLTELADLEGFKQRLWISYLRNNIEEYQNLVAEYKKGQTKIKEIIDKARNQQTDWENVIEIFNRRFYVPYKIGIKNKADTVLNDAAPNIEYFFEERPENVDEDLLLRVLSQGERRTLYLLNIIFEIESRKKQGLETFFIIDDIADSFDYKNKYAIIEYLKDVSLHDNFYSIILTHNFDFFRTVQERISGNSKYEGSYMALKEDDHIKLESLSYKYISNPLKNWKSNLNDNTKLIASVTFARNIAEYIGDKDNFNKLTSILHIKETTLSLTIGELEDIYKSVFRDLDELELSNKDRAIYDVILEVANDVVNSQAESIANLENKVVMSIAIRLNAEKYMISIINDDEFVTNLKKNQTGKLFGKYKNLFPDDSQSIKVLERVNIMTPENIHLNSFMFEPILDISDYHLKQLYNDVLQLIAIAKELSSAAAEVASTQLD